MFSSKDINWIRERCQNLIKNNFFNEMAFAAIDFNTSEIFKLENFENKPHIYSIANRGRSRYFDLASISKPLNLSALYFLSRALKINKIKESDWSDDLLLLLNHKSSLPAYAILDNNSYKQQILNYAIRKSETNYSDLGALRLMLELKTKYDIDFDKDLSCYFDRELFFWKNANQINNVLKEDFVPSGFRKSKVVQADVNDDNAFKISDYTVHAGMFASVEGLANSLINLNNQTSFISIMRQLLQNNLQNQNRFVMGWDTAGSKNSLAGVGCSELTFGHLGFTGTSVWIDSKKMLGYILLTNQSLFAWYDRSFLNSVRRELGEFVWSKF